MEVKSKKNQGPSQDFTRDNESPHVVSGFFRFESQYVRKKDLVPTLHSGGSAPTEIPPRLDILLRRRFRHSRSHRPADVPLPSPTGGLGLAYPFGSRFFAGNTLRST